MTAGRGVQVSVGRNTMQLVADDSVNRSIWTNSVELQRKIVEREQLPVQAGAQQAMPKACDQAHFSPENPLPWVPDLVGSRFGDDPRSVLVVASSYNGFIEGYSGRGAVMPLADYVDAKNAGGGGRSTFISKFKEHVVDRDEDYYQPILRDLLVPAGCEVDFCCITDLCKASFVERGTGADNGNRGDKGDDSVVRNHWQQWIPYVGGMSGDEDDAPLPYQWLWQRMQACRVIVALGTIAEYGVLKILQRMAAVPNAWSWNDSRVVPDHPTMAARGSDWEYAYACSQRTIGKWLANEDWWALSDSGSKPRWFLLPVYHPAFAIVRGKDRQYVQTVPRLRRLMEEVVNLL